MRPAFDWNPGLDVTAEAPDGTARHSDPPPEPPPPPVSERSPASSQRFERPTFPDAPEPRRTPSTPVQLASGVFDDFFAAGEEGRYEGGPAHAFDPSELENDDTPVPVVVRTPEMDRRRARFAHLVAVAVGIFGAVLAVGLARQAARAATHEEAAPVVAARPAPAPRTVKLAPRASAAPPNAEATETPAPPVAKPEPVAVRPPAKPERKASPSPWLSVAPRTPLATAAPHATKARLPSVANFAQKTPVAPAVQTRVPTASF
jgi:hypothetical protein